MQRVAETTRSGVTDQQRAAFAAFYQRHGDEVLRALSVTLGDQELGRDATQEAMARAWRSWDQVRAYRNPAGWVYRVGLNWGRSHFRRVSRELLGKAHERHSRDPAPDDPALVKALATLPQSHRAVVVLRLYLDWSVEEVAEALGIPAGTVRSRQHTAVGKLRQRLETPS